MLKRKRSTYPSFTTSGNGFIGTNQSTKLGLRLDRLRRDHDRVLTAWCWSWGTIVIIAAWCRGGEVPAWCRGGEDRGGCGSGAVPWPVERIGSSHGCEACDDESSLHCIYRAVNE